jgi:hypothetical protein
MNVKQNSSGLARSRHFSASVWQLITTRLRTQREHETRDQGVVVQRTSKMPKSREVPRGVLFQSRTRGAEVKGSVNQSAPIEATVQISVGNHSSRSVSRSVASCSVQLRSVASPKSASPRSTLTSVFQRLKRTASTLSVQRLVQRFAIPRRGQEPSVALRPAFSSVPRSSVASRVH